MRIPMSHERSELAYPAAFWSTDTGVFATAKNRTSCVVVSATRFIPMQHQDIENPQRIQRKLPFGDLFYA